MRLRCAILGLGLAWPCPAPAQEAATNSAVPVPPSMADAIRDLLSKSSQHEAGGKMEQAISEATLAIQFDPHNAAAYEQRGSIYIEEKLWDRAERDYAAADKLNPDIAYKYKLAEIKFRQKAYDEARPRFVAMEGDPRLGDLATYKVFLCDLLGGHEAASVRELGALDPVEKNPSYYYSHIAWGLYHNQRADAEKWFASAQQIFDSSTHELYMSSLIGVPPTIVTFLTKDGRRYEQAHVFLESTGLRTSNSQGWVTLPLEQLPDDLSAFPAELQERIAKQRAALPNAETQISLLSFTTRSGKSYEQVRWALEDDGLSVLTPDGWITVPFGQLPADVSSFPADLQQAIGQRQKSVPEKATGSEVVSFTTKTGKKYDQARATLTDDGLRILTPDGRILVPFAALPDDLSAFPVDWRPQLLANHSSVPGDPLGMKFVSFTTRMGKHYDQVRAAIEGTGFRLLTSQGLIAVPFDQLPEDLSPFPEDWREKIILKQDEILKSAVTAPSGIRSGH